MTLTHGHIAIPHEVIKSSYWNDEHVVDSDFKADELGLYDPRSHYLPYPPEKVLTNFQSGHGFVKMSAAGTQADDTTDYVKGNQSLKLTTDGDGNWVFTRKSSIAPTIDLTGKYLKVWVKVSDMTNTSQLRFYVSSDDFASAYYGWNIEDDINQIKGNVWIVLTLSFGKAVVTGAPNRAAINAIQLRLTDKNGVSVSANFGGISAIDEPSEGVVSITFDDGWASQYDEARKKMDKYGFPGTCYIIPQHVGEANYMTLTQLHKLQDLAGWSISTHASPDLSLLTYDEVESIILELKNYMLKNGFGKGADDFDYPMGAYNENIVIPLVRKYFRSARTVWIYPETYPPADYHKLRVLLILNTTPVATIQGWIDNAITNKDWLILVFHRIVAVPGVNTEYSIADFGTVIDYIATQGVKVKTISDVLNGI